MSSVETVRATDRRTTYVEPGDADYPERLSELSTPPKRLYALGAVELLGAPMVAIVGTRHPTAYGERVCRELASAFARAGVGVVSGMARGIDAMAHESTMAQKGRTVAVLGTGVDVPYPAGHAALHRSIVRSGLVVSELPPGARAHQGAFPRRNRIIAALGSVTIIVEAGSRSGALITASHALELGRAVAAVPGRIDSPQSAGTNGLIRDGALAITSIEEALTLAGVTPPLRVPREPLPEHEQKVWDALADGSSNADAITARTGLPARECMVALSSLEIAGLIECLLTGEVRRR